MKTRRTFSLLMELCKAAVLVFACLFVLASPTQALPAHQEYRPHTGDMAAAVRSGHQQEFDSECCQRHSELVAAIDARNAAHSTWMLPLGSISLSTRGTLRVYCVKLRKVIRDMI